MSDYCKICMEYVWKDIEKHKCKPLWFCRIDDEYEDEEITSKVYALSEEYAAEQYAEDKESDWEYQFVKDGEVKVDVKNPRTKEIKKFCVFVEHVISYSASEVKEE